MFEEIGEIRRVGVVSLVLLACVLMVTTKNVVNFIEQEMVRTPVKILATPMALATTDHVVV